MWISPEFLQDRKHFLGGTHAFDRNTIPHLHIGEHAAGIMLYQRSVGHGVAHIALNDSTLEEALEAMRPHIDPSAPARAYFSGSMGQGASSFTSLNRIAAGLSSLCRKRLKFLPEWHPFGLRSELLLMPKTQTAYLRIADASGVLTENYFPVRPPRAEPFVQYAVPKPALLP